MTDRPSYADRIVQEPAILVGKPVIKGPVEVVLEFLAHNPNFDELFADYARLTMDDSRGRGPRRRRDRS